MQIASDTALGAAGTAIGMNGGTLRTTQNLAQSRAITLGAQGAVEPQAGTTLTLASSIGGAGSLTKLGDGTAILTGSNSYGSGASVADGVTLIKAGTLQVGNGGTSGNIVGTVSNEGCWRSTARTAMSRPRRSRAAASWSSGAAARPCSMPSTPTPAAPR